jgi:hypothetical protein
MRRIRQSKMPQRVGHQQMREIVGTAGGWHGAFGQHRQPQGDGQDREQQHAPSGSPRQPLRAISQVRVRHDQ